MEHRMNGRIPVSLVADVYKAGKKLGVFAVKDIGANGLCLTNSSGCLHADKFLQVVIRPPGRNHHVPCVMNALVAWSHGDYAGLLWASSSTEFVRFFDELSSAAA